VIIHLLHHLVTRRLPKVAQPLVEDYFQVVSLRVVPDLHSSLGHITTPLFTLSVRYPPLIRSITEPCNNAKAHWRDAR